MALRICEQANADCPYYARPSRIKGVEHGCFSDQDHIVPQRLASTALATLFIQSPENKQQLCRSEHDKKTHEGDEPLPDRQTMLSSVMAQIASGELVVSRNIKRRVLKGKI